VLSAKEKNMKFDWQHGMLTGLMVGLAVGWTEAPNRTLSVTIAVIVAIVLLGQRVISILAEKSKG
jgi:uncharacterized protein (DUF2062 family)